MASPPLRHNFTNDRVPDSSELSATEYNLNAVRTDAALDLATETAAHAILDTDTSTAGWDFVVDEDTMSSNSATKVPTQQSVKAYVDANGGGGGGGDVVDDTTPQLGGDLDLNGHLVGAANAADLTKLHAITASAATLNNQSGTNTGDQTKASLGLDQVDNTSDVNKPVSTAQATADATVLSSAATAAASASKSADTITDGTTNKAYTATEKTKLAGIASGATANTGDALVANSLSQFASTTSAQLAGVVSDETGSGVLVFGTAPNITAPTGIVKGDVGLGNVDNTADTAKPVSTAQQTALDLKAPLASPTFTGTVAGVTKTHVGLANVDNTSDAAKPVSTLQAAADAFIARQSMAIKVPARHTLYRNLANTASPSTTEDTGQTVSYSSGTYNYRISNAYGAGSWLTFARGAGANFIYRDFDDLAPVTRIGGKFAFALLGATTYNGTVTMAILNDTHANVQSLNSGRIAVHWGIGPFGWQLQKATRASGSLVFTDVVHSQGSGVIPFATPLGDSARVYRAECIIADGLAFFYLPDGTVAYTTDADVTTNYVGNSGFHELIAGDANTDAIPGWVETWSDNGYQSWPGEQPMMAADVVTRIATKQPLDSDLTTIAGLTATTDSFLQAKASAWAARTPTQVTADLVAFVGDSGSGGTKGLVPAPTTGDATKYLKGNGTWATPAGGSSDVFVGTDFQSPKTASDPTLTASTDFQTMDTLEVGAATVVEIPATSTLQISPVLITAEYNRNLALGNINTLPIVAARSNVGVTTLTPNSPEHIFINDPTGLASGDRVRLPSVGVKAGMRWTITSNQGSSNYVYIDTAAGVNLAILRVGTGSGYSTTTFVAKQDTPTLAAHWEELPVGFGPASPWFSSGPAGTEGVKYTSSSWLQAYAFVPQGVSIVSAAGTSTLASNSGEVQVVTGSSTQTVKLPTTSITYGYRQTIINQSTGLVTVQSSGANTITILNTGESIVLQALQGSPTTAAHWARVGGTKWTGPRSATVSAPGATPTVSTDLYDQIDYTALGAAITSMTTNLTGTPVNGQKLTLTFTDDGTPRAITWGASFMSSGVSTLLATTVATKVHEVFLKYSAVKAKWVCMAVDATGY